jgi:hypothetical protein
MFGLLVPDNASPARVIQPFFLDSNRRGRLRQVVRVFARAAEGEIQDQDVAWRIQMRAFRSTQREVRFFACVIEPSVRDKNVVPSLTYPTTGVV